MYMYYTYSIKSAWFVLVGQKYQLNIPCSFNPIRYCYDTTDRPRDTNHILYSYLRQVYTVIKDKEVLNSMENSMDNQMCGMLKV